jgi:hypothetical protein
MWYLCCHLAYHQLQDTGQLLVGHTNMRALSRPTQRYLMGRLPLHVMYCRQRRPLYYGGENLKYYKGKGG